MSFKFKIYIALLVVLLVSMNIIVEELTSQHISGAEVLTLRSVFSLILIFAYSIFTRQSLFPKSIKLQLSSFFFSGLSILLIMTGFEYLSAGSVSTIQRMDIPLLILLASFNSKVSPKQFILSIITFIIIIGLVLMSKKTNENPIGYLVVFSGVICICINALIQRRIATKDKVHIIIAITSLSALLWSLLRCYQKGLFFNNISQTQVVVTALLGLFNIGILFLVTQLYKVYKPDFVRYPFLLCTFLTMIVEMIIEQTLATPIKLIGNTILLIIVTYLVKTRLDSEKTKL